MSLQTPNDIIRLAAKAVGIVGVGQTLLGEDLSDAFNVLQAMLGQWQRRRWLIWHLVDVAHTSTGAESYTVGPGGDFNVTTRPDRLEAAFFRQLSGTPNPVDYPLSLLEAREDYNDIALKSLMSFPEVIFYDSAFPVGIVYPWAVIPPSSYELHLTLKEQLLQFASIAQEIELPLEYMEALWTNLALRLFPLYKLPVDPAVAALASASLATIRAANAQVPRLSMPPGLARGGRYNVYSDQTS